jgi:hypothetical protein
VKTVEPPRFIGTPDEPSVQASASQTALPNLTLHESSQQPSVNKSSGPHSLVIVGLLILSAGASLIVLMLPDTSTQSDKSLGRRQARRAIARGYWAELDGQPTAPYQVYLREAQRAFHRGDYRQERDYYRVVLGLLRSERKPVTGITGSPGRDEELETHLVCLLSE